MPAFKMNLISVQNYYALQPEMTRPQGVALFWSEISQVLRVDT